MSNIEQGITNDEVTRPDTRYPLPDTRYPIPDTRYPIPDTRYPKPDTRYPIPDTRYLLLLFSPRSILSRLIFPVFRNLPQRFTFFPGLAHLLWQPLIPSCTLGLPFCHLIRNVFYDFCRVPNDHLTIGNCHALLYKRQCADYALFTHYDP